MAIVNYLAERKMNHLIVTYSGANPFIISICGTAFVSGINIRDSATNNFITNNIITNKFIMCLY